jgi:hypothetical protein
MTTSLHPIRARSGRRTWAVPALFAPALFVLTAALLSAVNRDALRAWGWMPLDHHGVPWPSSLALLPGGWLQIASFVATGAALIGLAAALPRGVRAFAVGACGIGLVAAGFPLDVPLGDPASLATWVRSWPAVVHAGGFAVAGLAGLIAVAASRRRGEQVLAVALTGAAVLGGTPGWYAFVVGFFAWVTLLADRTVRTADQAPAAGSARS